jgi:hypothetical protein
LRKYCGSVSWWFAIFALKPNARVLQPCYRISLART